MNWKSTVEIVKEEPRVHMERCLDGVDMQLHRWCAVGAVGLEQWAEAIIMAEVILYSPKPLWRTVSFAVDTAQSLAGLLTLVRKSILPPFFGVCVGRGSKITCALKRNADWETLQSWKRSAKILGALEHTSCYTGNAGLRARKWLANWIWVLLRGNSTWLRSVTHAIHCGFVWPALMCAGILCIMNLYQWTQSWYLSGNWREFCFKWFNIFSQRQDFI